MLFSLIQSFKKEGLECKAELNDDQELFCICQQPDTGQEFFIECSNPSGKGRHHPYGLPQFAISGRCHGWIHPTCFGMDDITPEKAQDLINFICFACQMREEEKELV